jgi:hypothetical protein
MARFWTEPPLRKLTRKEVAANLLIVSGDRESELISVNRSLTTHSGSA